LQEYDTNWRTYKPDVRRSKLLQQTDNTFKIYLRFSRILRAASTRIADLERPDSPEFPLEVWVKSDVPVDRKKRPC
jgi:hypothetical protein